MVVMIAAGQGAMLWIGLLKLANKAQGTAPRGGAGWYLFFQHLFSCVERVREEGPLTWVLYETQSKEGVSAWSIGRASRESQLDSSVEQ
jgi:hypothetical protein